MSITSQIKDLGYSDKEAQILLAVLSGNGQKVSEIATATYINRATVYSVLKKLLKRGVIREGRKAGTKMFFIDDIAVALRDQVDTQRDIVESILPQLAQLSSFSTVTTRLTTYEGKHNIRSFFLDILNKIPKGTELLEIVGSQNFQSILSSQIIEWYPKERVSRKIPIRTLSSITPESRQWKEENQKYLRKVRFIQSHDYVKDFSAIVQIFPKGIGLLSFREAFIGTIIESVELSALMRISFESLWANSVEDY